MVTVRRHTEVTSANSPIECKLQMNSKCPNKGECTNSHHDHDAWDDNGKGRLKCSRPSWESGPHANRWSKRVSHRDFLTNLFGQERVICSWRGHMSSLGLHDKHMATITCFQLLLTEENHLKTKQTVSFCTIHCCVEPFWLCDTHLKYFINTRLTKKS